jgi:chorismate-pyruvate lyase
MDLLFVSTEFLLSNDGWFSAEAFAERHVPPLIRPGLQTDGLLTSALQRAYGLPSSVEFRRHFDWVEGQAGTGLRRDVLIKTGETVRVVAATLMPHQILAHHPWLATMGNNPLGEMLEKHARYRRGDFEFTQLNAKLISPSPADSASSLWARRYRFFLADHHLLVTEIFLPGALERLGTI